MNAIQNPNNPPPSYTLPPEPKRSGVNPWVIRIPILLFTGVILTTIILGMLLVAFQVRITDRIVPGVSVMGVELGGKDVDEAIAALATDFSVDRDTTFTFVSGGRSWEMSGADLGVALDIGTTIETALEIGHSDDVLSNLIEQAGTWVSGSEVAPVMQYDQNIARNRLNQIAREVNQPPRDATITINGSQVETTEPQNGQLLDVEATLRNLDSAIVNMEKNAEIPLVMNTIEPNVLEVERVAEQVQEALSAPVTLIANDADGNPLGPWTITPEQIAGLLQVDVSDLGPGVRYYDVQVDTNTFRGFLETLAPGLISFSENARFHFDETTRELVVIEPASDGRELDIDETLRRLELAIFTTVDRRVPMAFKRVPAIYHDSVAAAELGITELVSEQTTYFWGSEANRRTNIAVAASKFDGVIIAPGQEFSFNSVLGDISEETGFVEGKIIFGGRTIAGLGGGVCQVSTTAFRTAIHSGFPIVERNSHGYRVGYYELGGFDPGLDAAIWTPDQDFRFLNDTDYHLLIETSFNPSDSSLTFSFYSTNPGRRIEVENAIITDVIPAPGSLYIANEALSAGQSLQVDYAADGADVTVTRKIYDDQGALITSEDIYTHYLPWQAVFEVAPGDPRINDGIAPAGQVG